ncbi:MAG: hemerythrin family protein [Zoogloeaceae bacterium]|nr:hemerythrin family protein [Rhodocyclaceae bacterium]MCP5235904.1 hemerythrin family protein [Zoogloeaceae bacterium]
MNPADHPSSDSAVTRPSTGPTRRETAVEIDEEHRIQARLIRALAALLGEHGDTAELLVALVQYSRQHFDGEERAMARYAYPGAAQHCAEHRRLCCELDHLLALDRSSDAFAASVTRLVSALRSHVDHTDARLLGFLRGVAGGAPLQTVID